MLANRQGSLERFLGAIDDTLLYRRESWLRNMGKGTALRIYPAGLVLVGLLLGASLSGQGAIAPVAAEEIEEEQINPLEIAEPDPLYPRAGLGQLLTPLERNQLEPILTELNTQAAAQLAAGKGDRAFELWYRELRLWRSFGKLAEIQALGRVGQIAVRENRTADVKIMTERLMALEEEIKADEPENFVLWGALGQAYEQVVEVRRATEIYHNILDEARKNNDSRTVEASLKALGRLYLAWFKYPEAAGIYQDLLALARSQFDDFSAVQYLEQLAYIYDKSAATEKAVEIKQQLIQSYLKKQEISQLLVTRISLGADYEALERAEEASQMYQETFTLAWSEKQFTYASEALQKLGELYQSYNQLDYALQIHQEQVKVQQAASDIYGLMNTYDRIGQIYFAQENYPQAVTAFEEGLQLARSLSYREAYFRTQIERSLQRQDEGWSN